MNAALWWKSVREGWWLLIACAVLMYIFAWMNVWLVSEVETRHLWRIVRFFRNPMLEQIIPVPLNVLISPGGRIAAGFDHPLVIVPTCVWAIARGSDCISGEIGRGTMEVLLAQPVRRIEVLLSQAVVTLVGSLLLCTVLWLGIYTGMNMFAIEQDLPPSAFLPAASNLFFFGFALAGLTTLLSSFDRHRPRTIGLAVGILLAEVVIHLISVSAVEAWSWLRWATFISAYQPQVLSLRFWPDILAESAGVSWTMLLEYNCVLLTMAVVCYTAAAVIFCRRDLPAPL